MSMWIDNSVNLVQCLILMWIGNTEKRIQCHVDR